MLTQHPVGLCMRQGSTPAQAAMNEILDVAPLRRLPVSSSTADLLTVLTLLEALNRLGPGLAAEAATFQGKAAEAGALAHGAVPRAEFVSNNVAPKLAQQLKARH